LVLSYYNIIAVLMAAAACNVNFANVYMIAYSVRHVYTRASLIHPLESGLV